MGTGVTMLTVTLFMIQMVLLSLLEEVQSLDPGAATLPASKLEWPRLQQRAAVAAPGEKAGALVIRRCRPGCNTAEAAVNGAFARLLIAVFACRVGGTAVPASLT